MKKVLVVDDDPLFADGLSAILKVHGYEVTCCYSGRDCIEKVNEFLPDVIISDHVMGDMNGLEILKTVRGSERISKIPFIVVTGFATRSLREELTSAGASAVHSKSDVSQMLLTTVQELLDPRVKKPPDDPISA